MNINVISRTYKFYIINDGQYLKIFSTVAVARRTITRTNFKTVYHLEFDLLKPHPDGDKLSRRYVDSIFTRIVLIPRLSGARKMNEPVQQNSIFQKYYMCHEITPLISNKIRSRVINAKSLL